MICGNTQAEIARDTQTDAQERVLYALNAERHKLYTQMLLDGVTIEENGRKYSLYDRMIDEYEEFAACVDSDIDFMAMFKSGKFSEKVNKYFKQEARTLASIIVG